VGNASWNGREHNHLLLNRGGERFVEAGAALGLDHLGDARGLAAADFDHDGDIDFIVNNYEGKAAYFVNGLGDRRRWLAIRLVGAGVNKAAIGAEIRIKSGHETLTRLVGAGHGYAGQFSLEQVFGLGDTDRVDAIDVRWPGGQRERFDGSAAGRRLVLTQGQGAIFTMKESSAGSEWAAWPWTAGMLLVIGAGLFAVLRRRRA